ncbi:carboxymuconolactone decarboxylase family protein [Nakamurella aerolata]|uniref:Carboxymuconolactone decarboxylase family protein n=1 Tax=Nakamurella aerolata TaxID=1656892 RepID=A0A849AB10_9ACTN|nr:carboxymuconolactone decarboxylase family protein [Nakamurella aerolata]NNG35660.1 carboxymuconolactone decarboxylase family protein [Nakamurella aerolata]
MTTPVPVTDPVSDSVADRFVDLDEDSAPSQARGTLSRLRSQFGGRLPSVIGRMAASPTTLRTFLDASAAFESTSLTPLQRETVIMTVAVRNGCEVCVQLHSRKLVAIGADRRDVDALRARHELSRPDLLALQRFTHAVMDTAGAATPAQLAEFKAAGFRAQQALEVGAYTLSTYANRLTRGTL